MRKVNKATWGRTSKGLMPKAYPLGYKKVTKRLQKGYKRVTKGLPNGYKRRMWLLQGNGRVGEC